MRESLSKAVHYFFQEPIAQLGGACPISETDAKIIVCLTDYAKKKEMFHLQALLEQWKSGVSDDHVLSAAKKMAESAVPDSIQESDGGEKATNSAIVVIAGKRFKLRYVYSYEPYEDYISPPVDMLYPSILINSDESSKMLYANTIVRFSSVEERDNAIASLDEAFGQHGPLIRF